MMIRGAHFAVLLWSSLLASTCQSFSVVPNAGQTHSVVRSGSNSVRLQAGPPVQELERTATEGAPTTSSTPLSSLFPNDRQVLKFVEPQTNVTVMLIGSMHYNPASISLVEKTVDELGSTDKLASVIIESCDIRWNKTQEMMDKKKEAVAEISDNEAEAFIGTNPNKKDFLGNEMRAAWEVATKYYRPTVLGDQRINITTAALKQSLKDTAKDLFLSGPEGWKRSQDEIVTNWKATIPVATGEDKSDQNDDSSYLSAVAFFDPRLLISLPVSLVKYPLSFLLKDPVPVGTFFAIIAALNFYGDFGSLNPGDFDMEALWASVFTVKEYPVSDYLVSIAISVLETVIFARLLLKPLLADRNEILARSVLDQCLLYASARENDADSSSSSVNNNGNGGIGGWIQNLLSQATAPNGGSATELEEAPVYVPGSDPESMRIAALQASSANGNSNNEGKVVVAVLGMAHCNGVMKLLREQKV